MHAQMLVEAARNTNTCDGLLDKLMTVIKLGKQHDCKRDTVEFALRRVCMDYPELKNSERNAMVAIYLRRY